MTSGSLIVSFALVLLVLSVIFVNGATDAPGAIAGIVSSGSVRYRTAAFICALFNFFGMFVASLWIPCVSETINSLMDFGDDLVVVASSCLGTIVIFASVAWFFGIPTSESHAMIASLAGASAFFKGTSDAGLFTSVALKSVASCAAGCAVGPIVLFFFKILFKNGRLSNDRVLRFLQCSAAAFTSACHGMQDGQKFIAVLFAVVPIAGDGSKISSVFICSLVMAAGCALGGGKIIDKIGRELTGDIGKTESLASDIGAVVCSVGASVAGIPISTTYMKTCSMIGSAAASGKKMDRRTLFELIATWAATYPVCMAGGYGLCFILDMIIK